MTSSKQRERRGRGRRSGSNRRGVRRGSRRLLLGVVVSVLAACGSEREEPVLVLRAEAPTPAQDAPPEGTPRGEATVATVTLGSADTLEQVPAEAATPVTFEEAEALFRSSRYAEAADLFEAYAERVPTNPWGHYMLGMSAWRAGDRQRAEISLLRTLELDPDHEKGTLNLARVLLEEERPSEALELASRVVERSPGLGQGWRVLGNVHAELGRRDDAVTAYRRAVALDPDDAWTLNNLGLLAIQTGDFRGALGPLGRATELEPEVAVFQNNLGVALERGGYLTEAAEAFQAALDVDPDLAKARVSLERVKGLGPSTPLLSAELAELAALFDAEIRRWQSESRVARDGEEPSGGLEPGW